MEVEHKSDCAVHNEPAYPKGECTCGASEKKINVRWEEGKVLSSLLSVVNETILGKVINPGFLEYLGFPKDKFMACDFSDCNYSKARVRCFDDKESAQEDVEQQLGITLDRTAELEKQIGALKFEIGVLKSTDIWNTYSVLKNHCQATECRNCEFKREQAPFGCAFGDILEVRDENQR